MPVSELDLVQAGLKDFRMDNLRISRHALQRARERHIPLEDLRRRHGNVSGFAVQQGNTIVTALTNQMRKPPKPYALRLRDSRVKIRKLIETLGLTISIKDKDPSSYTFFMALLQHHPKAEDKRVRDIVDLSLTQQDKTPSKDMSIQSWKDLMLLATYADGTQDSISWSSCLESYLKANPENITL